MSRSHVVNTDSRNFHNLMNANDVCVVGDMIPASTVTQLADVIFPKLAISILERLKPTPKVCKEFFSDECRAKTKALSKSRTKKNRVFCEANTIEIKFLLQNRSKVVLVEKDWTLAMALKACAIETSDRWWLSCKDKPLNIARTFEEYGIGNGDCIILNERMRGGSALYTHVAIAEKEVLTGSLTDEELKKALEIAWEKYISTYKLEAQSALTFQFAIGDSILQSITEEMDYYVKLAEDCLVMLYMLSKVQTNAEVAGAIGVFAKLRTDSSLTFGAMQKAMSLAYDWFFKGVVQVGTMEQVRDVLDNYESLKHSQLAEKLHCFMLFALGHSLFDSVGCHIEPVKLRNVCAQAKQEGAWKSADFAYLCIESIVFLCERGYQAYTLGSVQPLFHSGKNHEKWLDDCAKLKLWSTCLGNPEPHGFTIFQYQNELEEAIEKGESVVKLMATLGAREKALAQTSLNELRVLKSSLITTNDASKDRVEPFGVLIAGGSSVMKTVFSKILFYHYGKIMGLPTTKDYRYVRNPLDDYWSGFKSYKWCVQLDDIAAFRPTAVQGVDPSVAEALQILNTVAYVTNQAELADKGRVPMRARLVTATTNVIDLNAFAYYENDLAPRRRFPLVIKLELKPEFTKNGMCDTSKIPALTDDYHDVWLINIYRVELATNASNEVVPRQRGRLQFVKSYTNIAEFLADYACMINAHFETQMRAEDADGIMERIEVCAMCYRVKCTCPRVQARESALIREHACAADRCVERQARTPRGWVVTDASGLRFSAPDEALFQKRIRGMDEQWMYCPTLHETHDSDPKTVVMHTDDLMNVSEAYFEVLRERNCSYFGWVMSYLVQWVVYFGLQWRVGKIFMDILFSRRWTRHTMMWFFQWAWPNQARYVSRLLFITMDGVVTRHPRLVKIACFCTSALVSYWAVNKLLAHNEPKKKKPFVHEEKAKSTTDQEASKSNQDANWEVQLCTFRPPKAHAVEYENVWSDHDVKKVRFAVSDMSASWAGLSWDNVHKLVKWNTAIVHIRFEEDGVKKMLETRALCVKSRVYIINKHAWRDNSRITMIFESEGGGICSNLEFPSFSVKTSSSAAHDVMAMEILHAPVRKDLTQLFTKEHFEGSANGMYLVRHPDHVERVMVNNIKFGGEITLPTIPERVCVYYGKAARETVEGECGSPLFGRVQGAMMLLGVHVAGYKGRIASLALTQSVVENLIVKLTFTKVSTGGPMLNVGNEVQRVEEPHPTKSHSLFEQGCAIQVGGDPGFRPKGASKVGSTLLRPFLEKRGIFTDKCAPNLKSWKPFSLALKDLLHTNRDVDIDLLHNCAVNYVEETLPLLSAGWEEDVHFYDLDSAINGVDGVAYVDALNKNTSAGAPCNKTKRNYLIFNKETERYELNEAMSKAVSDIEECYANGKRATPVFMAHLKDQAIPKKKVDAEKVRVFVGGPMAWTIAVRQRLLWFIRLAQCNRIAFELGAGTVAQSVEWGHIYDYLTEFGADRIVAGDFGKFDKRMGSSFILYAFWIIVQFAEKAGMSDGEISQIWCIAEDTAFAFTNFNGDLIMFLGSNPSGHPLTVIVNSLVNSLYMRYVYRQVSPAVEVDHFKSNVHLYTYGDDNIMGVKRGCDWFNHTVIAEKLSQIGVEYTMADKESVSVPYIHIDDASFLKRHWRYDEDVGAMLAPLEEASIESSLSVGIVGKHMTPEAHAVAVIQGALNEYFFYGREVFESRRAMFEDVIREARLEDWVEDGLRTWSQCVASFKRSSEAYARVQQHKTRERLDSSGYGEAKTSAPAVTECSPAREH